MLMQMNPDLAQRFSLLGGGNQDQGVLARPAPQSQPQQQSPPQQQGGGGLGGTLNQLFTGSRKQDSNALIQAGLAAVAAAGQPGSNVLGVLAQGAQAGRGAGLANRDKAAMQEIIAQGGPQALQQLFLQAVGSGNIEAAKVLQQTMQTMQAGASSAATAGRPFVVGDRSRLVDSEGNILTEAMAEIPDLPAELDALIWATGQDPDKMSPAVRNATVQQYERLIRERARASGTNVNVNTGVGTLAKSFETGLAEGADQTRDFMLSIPRINRAIEITNNPKFTDVAGPFKSARDFLQRFSSDPEARQLAQEYDILTGEEGLRVLQSFTGPKSDKEMQVSFRLASGDRNLTAEELRAGLNVMRRSGIFKAAEWAREVLAAGPVLTGGTGPAWTAMKRRADRAMEEFEKEQARMQRAGISGNMFQERIPGGDGS